MSTAAQDLRYVYLPFADVRKSTTKTADGIEVPTRIVRGIMTDETVDMDGEIVDYDSAKKAAEAWFREWGNVREQHSSNVIGGAVDLKFDDDNRRIYTDVEVVDPLAIVKIDKKVLKGQSVGLRNARKISDSKAPHGRLVDFDQVEDSLVDRPANPTAKFAVVKMAKDGQLEPGEALIYKVAQPNDNKLATVADGKGSPVIDGLVADIDGLNKPGTAPAAGQVDLPSDTAGEDLDTTPGSALRRRGKKTPELGGKPSGQAGRQSPKAASPVGGTHGHLHTHNAGTDQEYSHDHGHDHEEGLHGEGEDGDHQHDHVGKAAKSSIIDDQAADDVSGAPGDAVDVTSPSGATAGDCPDDSCNCGGCGPSCEGTCCENCTMGDEYDRRESMTFSANAEYVKFIEAGIYKRDFSSADRKRLAGEGKAMPDGSFPIANEEDLHNAIRAVGRASDPAAAKKHIVGRARAMGMTDALPDDWKKSSTATTKKTITPEEALEMSYATAAPSIKAALEKGDTKAALELLEAAKGSIIAGQAQPAQSGQNKKKPPEDGGDGAATDAPDSEDVAPTKAATADFTKAITSEVSKAVSTALEPLKEEIEKLKKRAQPGGPMLGGTRLLDAPDDVKGQAFADKVKELEDMAENHPDRSVAAGAKALVAELKKSA